MRFKRFVYFNSSSQLTNGLDTVMKALVGTLAGTEQAKLIKRAITDLLKASNDQVSHVSNSSSIFWNSQKDYMNYSATTVTMVWKNGNNLTIAPALIKVTGKKEAFKFLIYSSESMHGSIQIKKSEFNFTNGYLLNAIRDYP